MEKIFLKGTENEGIEFTCIIAGFQVQRITQVKLFCFGVSTIVPDFTNDFLTASLIYCQIRFDEESKWRSIEHKFMERFKETIIIENHSAYMNACSEYQTRTRHDEEMNDLNN